MNDVMLAYDVRLGALERQVRRLRAYAAAVTLIVLALPLVALTRAPGRDVLRTRGVIIEDERGVERILIGAPVPAAANRVRTDFDKAKATWGQRYPNMEWFKKLDHSTNGMVILDANGQDRIVIGDPTPDPNIGRRIAPSVGIVINDAEGFERSGWGYFPKLDRVGFGLDRQDGEGVNLFIREDGACGIRIQDRGGSRRTFLGFAEPKHFDTGEAVNGLLVLDDQRPRILIDAAGAEPRIELRDKDGATLQALPHR